MYLFDRITVGGIEVANTTRAQMAEQMLLDRQMVQCGRLEHPRVVTSANGAVIAAFHSKAEFRRSILQADIVDADGMPLVFASRILNKSPLKERIATTDFIYDACAAAAAEGIRFYFLGGKPGVAEKAAEKLRERFPGLQIVGARHGYFENEEVADICAQIRQLKVDVLWVGLGSPKQEAFAVENRDQLEGLTWIRTCGGLFDHVTGRVKRAPLWMQKAGLEWLHRVIREPRRLGGRYLKTNPLAAYHLLTKTYDRVRQSSNHEPAQTKF